MCERERQTDRQREEEAIILQIGGKDKWPDFRIRFEKGFDSRGKSLINHVVA